MLYHLAMVQQSGRWKCLNLWRILMPSVNVLGNRSMSLCLSVSRTHKFASLDPSFFSSLAHFIHKSHIFFSLASIPNVLSMCFHVFIAIAWQCVANSYTHDDITTRFFSCVGVLLLDHFWRLFYGVLFLCMNLCVCVRLFICLFECFFLPLVLLYLYSETELPSFCLWTCLRTLNTSWSNFLDHTHFIESHSRLRIKHRTITQTIVSQSFSFFH